MIRRKHMKSNASLKHDNDDVQNSSKQTVSERLENRDRPKTKRDYDLSKDMEKHCLEINNDQHHTKVCFSKKSQISDVS